jgi:uncharacterized small protein (DUF1192 family)
MIEREASQSWSIIDCLSCGKPFGQEEAWMHDCPICFKESKGYKLLKGDLAFARLQAEVARLQDELGKHEEEHQAPSPELLALEAKLAASLEQNTKLQRLRNQLKLKVQQLEGEVARLTAQRNAGSPAAVAGGATSIDLPLLRKMLLLCHPDKNPGSPELATEVTQWLLQYKTKIGR